MTVSRGSRVFEASCEKIKPKASITLAIKDTTIDSLICFLFNPKLCWWLSALTETKIAPDIIINVATHWKKVGSLPKANLIKNTNKGLMAVIGATIETGPICNPLYKHKSPNIIKIPDRKLLLSPMELGLRPFPKKENKIT